ncbi:MAG: aminotransferase class I/II-fold pyridoxal phosphate-dependent enzyme [Thermoleophilia bacterium]|nr:aminotransferase class I/II-fold pyridoxal phosphate-dependent enzyme [Thermoleophilia bacterium]
MRPRPDRIERLPEQYFTTLLARVLAAGDDVIDVGRGNPDVPPPPHVIEALAESARDGTPAVHGYPPFAGLRKAKEAIAERYAAVYGVELDPLLEVALLPGTTTALVELPLVLAERGERILLPDPGYPDYRSGVALAGAEHVPLPLDDTGRPDWDGAPRENVAAVFLNYPANPAAVAAPTGVFEEAIAFAQETGAAVVHDFAYGDLVFDGRRPESFLGVDGAGEVGVEMFSLSKSYGMAGWRLGFVLGNEEIVARLNLLQEHNRSGIFVPLQRAAIAALTGPQETVEERRALYEGRRDRVLEAIPGARCEGSFFVWFPLPDGLTFERLLDEYRVAVAPGEGFGAQGRGYARLSLATRDEALDEGIARLRQAFADG